MAFSLLSAALLGGASLYVIMGELFLTFGCLGLVLPTAMVLALDKHGAIAGLASSLGGGGALQMMVEACAVAAMGPFFNGTAFTMITTICICSPASFTLSRLA
jgi:MFS transporter, DHA1 family, multidrug resistance protein